MKSKSVESHMMNNVFRFVFRRKNKQRRRFANTRTGNLELTVRKKWKFKIDPTDFQRLTLRFIDYHRKSQLNEELNPLEFKWKISWNNRYSWDKNFLSFQFALDDYRISTNLKNNYNNNIRFKNNYNYYS